MPAVARIGDSVLPGCGHTSTIVSGSGTTNADGIPVARIGDSTFGVCPLDHSGAKGVQIFVGSGTIISGSGTTNAD